MTTNEPRPSKRPDTPDENGASDIIWGVDAIGAVINRPRRQTYHLLESGKLPAVRIGGRWCSRRGRLLAHVDALINAGAA
jgi:hypothetical protein